MAADAGCQEAVKAVGDIAHAGMTVPGELARVTGLSRRDAGLGNRALVAEGYATMPGRGIYRLASFPIAASSEDDVLDVAAASSAAASSRRS